MTESARDRTACGTEDVPEPSWASAFLALAGAQLWKRCCIEFSGISVTFPVVEFQSTKSIRRRPAGWRVLRVLGIGKAKASA